MLLDRKHDENLLKNLVVVAPISVVKENRKVLAFSNFKKNCHVAETLVDRTKRTRKKETTLPDPYCNLSYRGFVGLLEL